MGNDIRVSDAGMQVRGVRGCGTTAAEMNGRAKVDLWKSPLDDVPKAERVNRELSGDQMRLKNLLKPYSDYRLGKNSHTTEICKL